MAVDFWEGKIKINYNSVGPAGDPFEREAGFTEKYKFPISISNPGTIRTNFRNLIAARVSLLAAGFYVFNSSFAQKSFYRSRYPLNGSAYLPVMDRTDITLGAIDQCNDPEAGLEIRFEHSSFRRWDQVFRGLRDGFVTDDAPNISGTSYGATAADTPFFAPQTVPVAGTPATFTYTLTGGVISAPIVATGGSGYANGGGATLVPLVITDPTGAGVGATGTATIVAGVVTAAVISAGGTGYSASTTITVPLTADPFGLAMYQNRADYLVNFYNALGAYCVSGHPQRVANAAFPSGFCTQFNNTAPYLGAYPISRLLPQRVTTRQTGQINTTSRGRKKTLI